MTENFPQFINDTKAQIQKFQGTLCKKNTNICICIVKQKRPASQNKCGCCAYRNVNV